MEQERMALSQRERDRLRVLHEVEQGRLKQVEAPRRLRLSVRQVRRLRRRVEVEGDRGLLERLVPGVSFGDIPRGDARPSFRKAWEGRIRAVIPCSACSKTPGSPPRGETSDRF